MNDGYLPIVIVAGLLVGALIILFTGTPSDKSAGKK
jgi:hypothetical protein